MVFTTFIYCPVCGICCLDLIRKSFVFIYNLLFIEIYFHFLIFVIIPFILVYVAYNYESNWL